MPTVSVIIPTYNRASMLKEAIQSVLDQTFSDYEIIVVDDGSTDDTREVVNELNRPIGKVRYLYQDNRGRSAARNRGFREASGDYIAFLDADDKFLQDKLRKQVQALENNPDFGMAYSYAIIVDDNGKMIRGGRYTKTRLSGWIYPEMLFIKGTIITTPTVMVRTRVLGEIGAFDETMHTCEDLDLWRRIARHYKVLQIEEPLSVVRYRQNETPPLSEWVGARSLYYRKAIAEDPGLKDFIESKLFSEMYFYYGASALYYRNFSLAFHLLTQSAKANPFLFSRLSLGYMPASFFFLVCELSSALHLRPYFRCRRFMNTLRLREKGGNEA